MAKFADTPRWKREQVWDPVARRLVRPDGPATRKQMAFVRDLCRRRGVVFQRPGTQREAQAMIDRLRA